VDSFINAVLRALDKEEQETALETGRGKHGTSAEAVSQRVGYSKGLIRAQDIVRETAKQVAKESAD